jgi:hypothetical protein
MPLEAVKGGVSFFGTDLTKHARLKQDAPATSSMATTAVVFVVIVVPVIAAAIAATSSGR